MKYLLAGEETHRLLFRPIDRSDLSDWLEFFKSPAAFEHWKAEVETPEIECEKWYAKQFYRHENELGGMNALIEKESGKLVGHAGLVVQTVDNVPEFEIAYSLLPTFWNKGYASEAAMKCRDHGFKNNFSESLISIISTTNKASERVAMKNGMLVDKSTIYRGNKVNIFRIKRSDWERPNAEQ
jgi:RimJ/RimL family protein N-acetyltransferase